MKRTTKKKVDLFIETLTLTVPWVVVLYLIPQLKWNFYENRTWLVVLLIIAGVLVEVSMLKANWPKRKKIKTNPIDRVSQLCAAEKQVERTLLDMTNEVPDEPTLQFTPIMKGEFMR